MSKIEVNTEAENSIFLSCFGYKPTEDVEYDYGVKLGGDLCSVWDKSIKYNNTQNSLMAGFDSFRPRLEQITGETVNETVEKALYHIFSIAWHSKNPEYSQEEFDAAYKNFIAYLLEKNLPLELFK